MMESLISLHNQNYLHLDVKLENFFIKLSPKFDVVLGDFGLSESLTSLSNNNPRSIVNRGTYLHMAPEICRPRKDASAAIDVYSLGVTLFMVINHSYIPCLLVF